MSNVLHDQDSVFLNFTQEKSVTCMATLQPSWPGSTRVLVVTGGLVALLVWQHLSLGSAHGLVALVQTSQAWPIAEGRGHHRVSPVHLQIFKILNQTKALLNYM